MKYLFLALLLLGCGAKRPQFGYYRNIYDRNFFSARFTMDDKGIGIGQMISNIELNLGDTLTYQRGVYKVSFYRVPDGQARSEHKVISSSGKFEMYWDEFSDSIISKIDTNGYITYFP